ncbi:hypothetical protein [Candidatus Nitrosocosmicus sp. SS]|jgi:hypothetical protein|uniref:hypothetical protein n=1 Tax=Candidatus Nitrosocosmicus agrestis TaxID=2563600 RepID=UPI00122DCDAF|nr:hypothetical protein [Candidatus Nitrosocosmicus sp. SS]KAA2279403.1 hypothetical protein F1Z66_13525 [Candidatus Nitrosocosmicus sp. SS]KAF0868091.1 hypothetical protein E5N71_12065 [Candidatus Nitrosocosmicus sp. SS]
MFSPLYQNVLAIEFVSPEDDLSELAETSLDTELSRCYLYTYTLEADKETLQECFDNIMKYSQIVCNGPEGLEADKCQVAEKYVRYLYSQMHPEVCNTDPSRCTPPPRPVL